MTDDSQTDVVAAIMRSTRIAALTYQDQAGRLVSLPMGTQDFEHPGTVWFITRRDSDKVAALEVKPDVNVHYASSDGYVSLSGTARVSDDQAKLDELWDASADVFMPEGQDAPTSVLLEITATTAEFWDTPGKVATAVQLLKGAISDREPDLGDNDVVRL